MAESRAHTETGGAGHYRRHRPEQTLMYQIVEQHYPEFVSLMRAQGRELPAFVQREFVEYLKCGRLEYGFLRVRFGECKAEKLVAFSCKRRAFCPSCGARRMVDTAALLVDEVLPRQPVRQWVLSVPFALRFLFAREPQAMGSVLGIVIRALERHLIAKAGFTRARARTGTESLTAQRSRQPRRDCARPVTGRGWHFSVIHPLCDHLVLQPPVCIPEIPPATRQIRLFCC